MDILERFRVPSDLFDLWTVVSILVGVLILEWLRKGMPMPGRLYRERKAFDRALAEIEAVAFDEGIAAENLRFTTSKDLLGMSFHYDIKKMANKRPTLFDRLNNLVNWGVADAYTTLALGWIALNAGTLSDEGRKVLDTVYCVVQHDDWIPEDLSSCSVQELIVSDLVLHPGVVQLFHEDFPLCSIARFYNHRGDNVIGCRPKASLPNCSMEAVH
jgi:hypothetical protein